MSADDLAFRVEQLERAVTALRADLLTTQSQHLATTNMAVEFITKLSGTDRKNLVSTLSSAAASHYQRLLLLIGDTNPGLAESIDPEALARDLDADNTTR